ncbi:two-component system sensor histidine kinase MtrB [Thermobifida fusca]|uniref:Sensor histidine kinase MtrB n=3 Tax=Thermobifida fusca TaxID=2021 RepID=A0A9P2T9J7_THEFU|nr:ATP-binding region, ATPase-like:Histidine kinase, HAMP region:Histidine kinase A, N-terminal [Thermobifida fusca YX]EOR70424.1 sensor histidine kinase [Thermobifida fusca TM51]MBO2530487.1 sensor histidine kinase [Thermobifida sp.]PPS93837.1 histidine kinase [Thermobifida fusca]PZN62859.1 MAG: sensor histidine kinase [Thermobifida fusca]
MTDSVQAPSPNAAAPALEGEAAFTRWQRMGNALRAGYVVTQRLARGLVTAVHSRWRRSLQLRVVTTTLMASVLVTAILGFFMVQQVRSDLLKAKEQAAFSDHHMGLTAALGILQDSGQQDPERQLDEIVEELSARSGATGLYDVVILPSVGGMTGRASGGVGEASIPAQLREEVQNSNGDTQHGRYTEIIRGPNREPGLAVGAQLSSAYELYYLFPLDHEQQMLDLVQRTLALVASVMVLLLAAIAYVVTRQVVTPVRQAASSAEKLSSGDLSERMEVRGEDDLARLAVSFNDMAGSLQEKIQELEELSKVQRQFVSDVSHELRTPLTTIRMAGDLLFEERDSFDPTVRRSVELLQSQLERFEELLNDLLEISRHDAGAATLALERADIRDSVLQAVREAEQIAEKRGIKVILRLPTEPCTAEFDSRRINRILRNLIVNAIEHSEGKDVIVTAAADRDAVAVAVRDFGVGLKEGEEHLCFDRFWRADPARARTTGGTGLGLAIAKEDAQLHGGWLQAWGRPGKGAQFRLSLPRVAGTELRGSPLPLVPPEMALGGNLSVLSGQQVDLETGRGTSAGEEA